MSQTQQGINVGASVPMVPMQSQAQATSAAQVATDPVEKVASTTVDEPKKAGCLSCFFAGTIFVSSQCGADHRSLCYDHGTRAQPPACKCSNASGCATNSIPMTEPDRCTCNNRRQASHPGADPEQPPVAEYQHGQRRPADGAACCRHSLS